MLEPPIKQLLLVEDDEQGVIPAELFFDEEVWEDSGAPPQLLVARNADEFKQLLGQHQHTIEAIVTDIILSNDPTAPGVNGVAVYAQLADQAPDIPCFAITGQAPDSAAIEALRAGVVDYLKKPFSWDDLWAKIQTRVAQARANRDRRKLQQAVQEITRFLRELEAARKPSLSRELVRKIVEVSVLATGAQGGWLFLEREGQPVFELAVGYPELKDTPGQGIFREVFESGSEQCLFLTGQEQGDFLADFERGQSALLAVPLYSEASVLGVLALARPRGGEPFTPAQVSLMNQLSALGGTTLEAHLRELDAGQVLARALAWAVEQNPEAQANLDELSRQAGGLEPDGLWQDLARLRALGPSHLDFWRQSLRLYLENFE